MSQQQLIRIFVVNPPKAWSFEGKTGFSHSAECGLVDEKGEVLQVGVLKVKEAKKELLAKMAPGFFSASFILAPNPASRAIEAVLSDLTPLTKTPAGFVVAKAPETAKGASV